MTIQFSIYAFTVVLQIECFMTHEDDIYLQINEEPYEVDPNHLPNHSLPQISASQIYYFTKPFRILYLHHTSSAPLTVSSYVPLSICLLYLVHRHKNPILYMKKTNTTETPIHSFCKLLVT